MGSPDLRNAGERVHSLHRFCFPPVLVFMCQNCPAWAVPERVDQRQEQSAQAQVALDAEPVNNEHL